MNLKNWVLSAGALVLGLATTATVSLAQGPLYDKVTVDLPYSVTIGERTLQPGDYVIRQMRSDGGARNVLLIYSDNGMKFETSAMTIPTLDNRTPEDTKVVLHHFGNDYYFDKIWIQGKNYGYEFPLPDSVKARERERMQPISVAANYEAAPPEPAETAQTQPAPAPPPVQEQPQEQPQQPQQQAEAAPPPQTQPEVQQQPEPAPQASREMPRTADNWATMLLGGILLTGCGFLLRRKAWSL